MLRLRLTAKRQATFPVETCRSLGLQPGDTIELEPGETDGEKIWILRSRPARTRVWFGCLGAKANKVEDHSLEAIRASIASARKRKKAK